MSNVYTPATLAERMRRRERKPILKARERRGVYFIEMMTLPLIKVGFTMDIERRRSTIQTHLPFRVSIAAFYSPAEPAHETMLHNILAADHYGNEWFHYSRRVERVMSDLDDWYADDKITTHHGLGLRLERYKAPEFDGADDLIDTQITRDWLMRVF